jgi:protein tyrosine phosphatase (PTP) superfamily phosphohydrolase (DUF442 family)
LYKIFVAVIGILVIAACGGSGTVADSCPTAGTSPITNFCVATKDVLWRGGKPDTTGAAWLLDNDVKSIVNLELLLDDVSSLTSAKVTSAAQYDVNYFRIRNFEPVVALAPSLQDQQIAEFLAVMAVTPKPVYVHCRSGQNRTGVNVAAYRVLIEGVAIETAVAEMEKYQGIWFSYDAAYIRSFDATRKLSILGAAKLLESKVVAQSVIKCRNGVCVAS